MHPYRTDPVRTPNDHRQVRRTYVENLDVCVPLFVVGALGMVLGILSPTCTVEASVGAVFFLLSLKTLSDDVLACRRRRASVRDTYAGRAHDSPFSSPDDYADDR